MSLLHTNNALTLKSIMLELSVSRPEARRILAEIANQCDDSWTIVRIGNNNSGCVSLNSTEGSIFSIVSSQLETLPSVVAEHEKSSSDQRDLSSTLDGWGELLQMFGAVSSMESMIQPAPEYVTQEGGVRRVPRDRGFAITASTTSKSMPVKKGKETTAAAFFGAKKTTDKKTTSTIKEVKGKENNKTIEAKPIAKPSKSSSNVDDFEGDQDEDEDFLQQESERKARVAREARKEVRAAVGDTNAKKRNTTSLNDRTKSHPKKAKNDDIGDDDVEMEEKKDSDDEIEYDDCVSKPMDAFTKRTTEGGAKKRRKKLIEKTIMENGYLKTVTEEVWEEYEEEKTAVTTKPIKSAGVKNDGKKSKGPKKQGSLMGFFSKK